MKIYAREKELALLEKIEAKSIHAAQMTYLEGRKRIGKTRLLREAYEEKDVRLVLSICLQKA